MVLDDVEINSPNRAKATVGLKYGHGHFRSVRAKVGAIRVFDTTVESLNIGSGCMNPDGTPWTRAAFGFAVTKSGSGLLNGYLDGVTADLYHINPYLEVVNQRSNYTKFSGVLFTDKTTDPYAFALRVHTNAFAAYTVPKRVFGVLTLRGSMFHANAGVSGTRAYRYQFEHGYGATSGIRFDTTATETSGVGGNANNSLAITVSNPTQSGETQLGAGVLGDGYCQIDVSLTSGGRTSAKLSCVYELEIWAATA
jgi:hypothetical protein